MDKYNPLTVMGGNSFIRVIEHIYNWDDYSFVEVQHDVEFWMPRPECPQKEQSVKGE